jgi:hypothetical protein
MKNFLLFDLFILFEYYFIEICCKNKIKADRNNNILLNKNYYNNYDDNNILKNIFFDINNNLNILSEDNNSINYMQNSEEEEDSSSSEEYIFNIPVYLEEDTKIKFFYQNENISLNLSTNPKEINIENLNNFIDNFKDIFEEKFKNIKNLILNLSDSNYSLNSFNSNNIDYIKKEENFITFESKKFNNFDLSLELNGIIFEDPVFYLSYCPENFDNNKTYIDLLSYYSIFPKVFFDYFFNNFFNSKDECINSTYDNNNIIYIKCLYNKILISTIHKKLYIILENYVFPYEKLFNENFYLNNNINKDNYTYFNIIFKDIDYIILGNSFFYKKKIGYVKNTSEILIYSKEIHNFSKYYKNLNNKTFKLFLYIITICIISLLVIFFFIRFCYARYERKNEKISLELNQFNFEKKNN